MTALRCDRTLHAIGDDTGRIERYCRACTRHLPPHPYDDAAVYHYWRFTEGEWLQESDVIKRTPRD